MATSTLEGAIASLCQSLTGERRPVLVVSEVCAGAYGTGRAREGRAGETERVMG